MINQENKNETIVSNSDINQPTSESPDLADLTSNRLEMDGHSQVQENSLNEDMITDPPQRIRKLKTNIGYSTRGKTKNTENISEEMKAEIAFRQDLSNYKNRDSKIKKQTEETY